MEKVFQQPADAFPPFEHNVIEKDYQRKDFVLKAGEISQYGYFVEKGFLRMYSISENGKENIVQFASEDGLIFDRNSLTQNTPSTYFIQAIENSKVILIKKGFVEQLMKLFPDSVDNYITLLYTFIAHLQIRINLLLGASAEERYLNFLRAHKRHINRVPLWMIASYLGITPESLSRIRKDLVSR
jgi:CRP-like cAMP-binding protein